MSTAIYNEGDTVWYQNLKWTVDEVRTEGTRTMYFIIGGGTSEYVQEEELIIWDIYEIQG